MNNLIANILDKNTKIRPNQPALIMDNEIITYLQFSELVSKTVSSISKAGITPKHSVALRFNSPVGHFIYIFSLLKMGICQVSINPNDVVNVQNKVLSLVDDLIIIQDIPIKNSLIEETLYVDNNYNLVSNQFKIKEQKNNFDYKDIPALVFYGSGTTSNPKIIAINSSILAEQIIRDSMMADYREGENYYTYTELYYITSKRKTIAALYSGMSVYLPRRKPKNIISFCIDNNIDHLFLTANQAMIMLSTANSFKHTPKPLLPRLKSFVVFSAMVLEPLRKEIINTITKNFHVAYGTNEVAQTNVTTLEDIKTHAGTVGKALPGITLRVVDDNGEDCKIGEVGNVLIKFPNMISGYKNNPEATKRNFTKDGYYPGDLGRLTEDGNLILEGRKDDMMIFSGVNIYPRELESVLESHPKVIESAVFPLTINNNTGIPFAVVVVSEKIDEKELLKWCHEKSGWRRAQRIFFSKKLPRNNAGKILKRVLAQEIVKVLNSTHKTLSNI
jgi:acyl-coenzyme A synthetase/AMP-(fatty) acid ligase